MIEGITNGHLLIAGVLIVGYIAIGVIVGRNREMRWINDQMEILAGLMWSIQERQEEVINAASMRYIKPKNGRRVPEDVEERAREAESAKS